MQFWATEYMKTASPRRAFTPTEEDINAQAQQQWFGPVLPTVETSALESQTSPWRGAVLGAIPGAALGAGIGYQTGIRGAGPYGALLGGLAGGAFLGGRRRLGNAELREAVRRSSVENPTLFDTMEDSNAVRNQAVVDAYSAGGHPGGY